MSMVIKYLQEKKDFVGFFVDDWEFEFFNEKRFNI
jgi:hypothetical protein